MGRKNRLREALGEDTLWDLPKSISEELVDAHSLPFVNWLGFLLFMFVMIGGFAVGAVIWGIAENLTEQNAIQAAASVDGFSIDVNFGIGLLIGLFVWIGLSGWIVALITKLVPMPVKGALFLSQIEPEKVTPEMFQKKTSFMESKDRIKNASEFIDTYFSGTLIKSAKYLAPLSVIVIAVSYAELHSYSVMSETGHHKSGLFSNKMTVKKWVDAELVELGCNQTDDGGNLIYEVTWPDGKSKRLPIDTSINGKDWLTNLESVDTKISSAGATFERWSWNNRNPLHPKCLRGFYAELGPEGKSRIDSLLRIDELD
ncbi:MAG: hypothetical protein ABJO36_06745 [Litorimonas sp.]